MIPILPGATSQSVGLDVPPRLAIDDLPNGAHVHPEFTADIRKSNATCGVSSSNREDSCGIEHRGGAFFTATAAPQRRTSPLPILGVPVRRVIGMRADPQVRGVAARGVVARVTDAKASRNVAVRKGPRNPVGAERLPVGARVAAVALRRSVSRPRPASVRTGRLIDLGPEAGDGAIIQGKHWKLHSSGPLGIAVPRGAFVLPNYSRMRGTR